ncbi:MAG: HPr family phosphocarrier protein [Blautia sp.]|jgi:phosphocarrier protein HPr
MGTFNYVIKDEVGIHARPAGVLAKMVKGLDSTVTITKGGKTVDASKLMAVMSLGAKKGDEVTVASDSEEDLAAVKKFFEENL